MPRNLGSLAINSSANYTIPDDIFSYTGIYILAIGNSYGVGLVASLHVAQSTNTMKIHIIADDNPSFFTIAAVNNKTFKVTSGQAIGQIWLTRIA